MSLNVMLVEAHHAGQITTSDLFYRRVAIGDATARGSVKISTCYTFPSGTSIASTHAHP
ncbi:MAG: hypothetical protein LUQ56_04125 [Methylococcaceae bacterium]|nr:hypothetical protein [Methylococcaceae bacterium]